MLLDTSFKTLMQGPDINVDYVLDNLLPLNHFLVYRASTECTIPISCFAHLLKMFCTCQQMQIRN